jgi:hypothetical protein
MPAAAIHHQLSIMIGHSLTGCTAAPIDKPTAKVSRFEETGTSRFYPPPDLTHLE